MASTELRRLAKDFVSMRDLAPADLVALLDLAARLKAERVLRQRAVVQRTRRVGAGAIWPLLERRSRSPLPPNSRLCLQDFWQRMRRSS